MIVGIKQLFQQASSQGQRANVLKPIVGATLLFYTMTAAFVYLGAELYGHITMVISALFSIGTGFSYFFCLFKNPDLLRSEKYNLEKTALEKVTLSGDSLSSGNVIAPTMEYVKVESINQGAQMNNNLKLEE